MRRFWTVSGGLATAASLGIAVLALRASANSTRLEAGPASAVIADEPGLFVARGAGSCAAAACHGSATPVAPEVSRAKRDEHTTWITSDPHAGAFDVLLSDRSKRISEHLGKRSKNPIPAHEDSRCLACHATPSANVASAEQADAIRRDGVGCESCHGPTGGWLSAHTTSDWGGMSTDQRSALGFRELKDLSDRAMTCAGCHVGAPADPARGIPARDVNHDLIAAGHPRLNWEFAANSANYPKHWRSTTADLDARLWKIGQIASMKAALELLGDRALKADPKSPKFEKAPWPEFAEFGCYSCHFGLKETSLRVTRDPTVVPGSPAWGSWYVPMFKVLTETDPGAPAAGAALAGLRAEMNNLGPNPAQIAELVAPLHGEVDKWLKSAADANHLTPDSKLSLEEIASLIETLETPGKNGGRVLVSGWDSAAQLYLALASLYRSQAQLQNLPTLPESLGEKLRALRKDLDFKDGFDSPVDFNPAKVK